MTDSHVLSVLVVHSEPDARGRLLDTLRAALPQRALHAAEASSPTQALQTAAWLDPTVVLIDLSADRSLAFDVARALRRRDRILLGLYNPLLASDRGADLFRSGARAGFGDFVPLPASEAELAAALSALELHEGDRRTSRVASFISAQGGAGATTVAVNAALLLAGSKAAGEVAFSDGALQFGNAVAHLGLAPDRDLVDLLRDLESTASLSPYLLHEPETGLRLLAAPRDAADAERVTPEDLSRVLIALRRRFDTLVIDLPAALDQRSLAALDLSDRIYVVAEAVTPAVASTARLFALLERLGLLERTRLVLNRYASFEGNLPESLVGERLGRPVDHVVPYDRAVVVAANRGVPLVLAQRRGAFNEALGALAGAIVDASPASAPLRS